MREQPPLHPAPARLPCPLQGSLSLAAITITAYLYSISDEVLTGLAYQAAAALCLLALGASSARGANLGAARSSAGSYAGS